MDRNDRMTARGNDKNYYECKSVRRCELEMTLRAENNKNPETILNRLLHSVRNNAS